MSNYDLTTGTSDKLYQTHNQNWAVLEKCPLRS